jgi:hypothetical protein
MSVVEVAAAAQAAWVLLGVVGDGVVGGTGGVVMVVVAAHNSDEPNHLTLARHLQAYLRWRNAHPRDPKVLAAQRRERARIPQRTPSTLEPTSAEGLLDKPVIIGGQSTSADAGMLLGFIPRTG